MAICSALHRHTKKKILGIASILLFIFISQPSTAQTIYGCLGYGKYHPTWTPTEPDTGYEFTTLEATLAAAGDSLTAPGWSRVTPNFRSADGVQIQYLGQQTWPNGSVHVDLLGVARLFQKSCYCPVALDAQGSCPTPSNKSGPPACGSEGGTPGGNPGTPYPIAIGNGNKFLSQTDVDTAFLGFKRFYNSSPLLNVAGMGYGWTNNYVQRLLASDSRLQLRHYAADGRVVAFTKANGTWTTDADVNDKVTDLADVNGNMTGWNYYVAASDSAETYDTNGNIVSLQERSGRIVTFSYSDGTNGASSGNGGYALDANGNPTTTVLPAGVLLRVSDNMGHTLAFGHTATGTLVTVTTADQRAIRYHYDSRGNMASVIYPDNSAIQYLYDEAAYTSGVDQPHALTGIIDENNIRYVTYTYDAQGRAVNEVFPAVAGNVNHYGLSFDPANSTTTVTDPLGMARAYHFSAVLGMVKNAGQNQPAGSGCAASASNITYDANGNVASRTDFNGNITTYLYDLSRNLETSRTEAFGTPQARTISTRWHPTFRLPTAIAEPKKLTTYAHDGHGNVLTRTEQATTDADGSQGFDATPTGTPRTWAYTYNDVGQVLSVTGPRIDIVDKTTYAYDDAGNLTSITNAAGLATTLSNYDGNGRVGRIVDPNGLTTDLLYSPRGWLQHKTVSGNGVSETTTYGYDGVGQLLTVTTPDSTITYTHDDAHRLTDIADSLGNTIHYTLDATGNRIGEQVKDANGNLARQITRVYDALSRLQQITGGAQ